MVRFILVIVMVVGVSGCSRPTTTVNEGEPASTVAEPLSKPEETLRLVFEINAVRDAAPTGVELYDCRYGAKGKTARFRLELRQHGPLKGADLPIAAAEGKFIAVPGSDNSVLIDDLSKALEATHPILTGARQKELPFNAVVLGEKQTRSTKGGYTSDPPGDWKLLKIFLPKGGDEGEVFLDVNPVLGKGEFSIKGSDFGDYLVSELAKVL